MLPFTGTLLLLLFAGQLFFSCSSIPVSDFIGYPFSSSNHQIFASNDDNAITVDIAESVVVNGNRYRAIHINNNGVLNFNSSTTEYVPQPFPISGNEYIALFWTDIDTTSCPEIINTVYYRQFTVADSDSSSAFEQINKIVELSSEFKTISGCSALSFQARWAFAVTWREVRYYRGECDKYNDIQVVVATDGALTFAILNYARVDYDSRNNSLVGVNAGDGANFRIHPNSMTTDIYNIESEPGNTGELGQWVYRVDVISNETESIPGDSLQLDEAEIHLLPGVGNIFGGTPVRIVGPCVNDPKDIKCSFGKEEVDGTYLEDERQFLCVSPDFKDRKVGRVSFKLSFNEGGKSVVLHSSFYITVYESEVTVSSSIYPIPIGGKVTVTWSPDFLPLKDPQNYKVDITLYELVTSTSFLREIKTLLKDAPNSGSAEVTMPSFKRISVHASTITLFRVSLAQSSTRRKRQISKAARALLTRAGWGAGFAAAGAGVTSFVCSTWSGNEPDGDDLLDQVEPCPRTEAQARLPSSNFEEEVFNCFGVEIERAHELFHPEADVCFRQKTLRAQTRAGNQCCYKDGNLCTYKGCGGTVDKVSPRGDWESCKDHFIQDVLPVVCDDYNDKRPIDDGSRFTPPPNPACVYGDPHIVTLDGHKYTFNGKGEFTLVETSDREFILQGRMVEAMDNVNDEALATVFSAIVGKEANSDKVQIELSSTGGLIAFVDGEQVSFDDISSLEFRNVTVSDRGNSTISATFACGAYIEVKEENGIISVVLVSLSVDFRGLTRGLMGNYNGNTSDDLMPKRSNVPISLNSSLQVIHEQFGIAWIISNPRRSLFTYRNGTSWAGFYDPSFSPVFEPTFSDSDLEETAREICDGDTFCLFDIAATKRVDIGTSTMQGNQELNRIVEQSLPVVCDPECEHGLCVENDTCSCALGYKGRLCSELDVGPCDLNICENGGTCTRVSHRQQCDCREGYSGRTCQNAEARPHLRLLTKSSVGVVIIWSVVSPHVIEKYRLTVFDTTDLDIEDLNLVVEYELQPITTAFHMLLTRGHQYTFQVEARVNGLYSTPGKLDVIF
jgi:hypothetical protein